MSFANLTPFAALDIPTTDPVGREMALVVVKGTFAPDGSRLPKQAPVWTADIPWEPESEEVTSVKWPSDLALVKQGADVVVVGSARARQPTEVLDVVVRIGERRLHLRVHGERLFYQGAGGRIIVGEAARFMDKEIRYERAYGGTGETVVEQRNPIGKGVADDVASLAETQAPQIEWADAPIAAAGEAVEPAGLGAIPTFWMPRAGYGGTFDERWEAERMPLMPDDFDLRFYRCAHPRLQLDRMLEPGTPVGVDGMSEEGPIAITVPSLNVAITGVFDDGTRQRETPGIDTMVIDTDRRRVMLSVRAAFAVGRGGRRLEAIRVEPNA